MGVLKWNWAVGVTTAPRKSPTLESCLQSLSLAGWDSPRLFSEPFASKSKIFSNYPFSMRSTTLGVFPNWYLGLTELYLRMPHADAYLMFQDDALVARDARAYLENTLWPAAEVGVVSLYCPSREHVRDLTGFREINRGWAAWGAVAYIFSNPGVRQFLSDPVVLNHRHHGPSDGVRNIDPVVGSWCQRNQLPYFVHIPTLVQHIGATSTIKPASGLKGNRVAIDFDPEFPRKHQSLSVQSETDTS